MSKAVLDNSHKLFDNGNNRSFVEACCLCDFIRYCFGFVKFSDCKITKNRGESVNFVYGKEEKTRTLLPDMR